MQKATSVDEYIAAFPAEVQALLSQLRQIIKTSAPDAQEKLSYGMPYYSLRGRLVYFGGFKDHISLFPMKTGITAFQEELKDYETSAGTIQFALDKPLDVDLIKKIVKFRVNQNLSSQK